MNIQDYRAAMLASAEPSIAFGRALIIDLAERASELTRIPVKELRGPRRYRDVAYTRFAIMKVARERGRSLTQIGRFLGDLDHTSIMYGIKRAIALELSDPDFAKLVRRLREEAGR